MKAIADHTSTYSNELSMKAGTSWGIAGNEKDGMSVDIHILSSMRGDFPLYMYKLEEEVLVVNFPTYPKVH